MRVSAIISKRQPATSTPVSSSQAAAGPSQLPPDGGREDAIHLSSSAQKLLKTAGGVVAGAALAGVLVAALAGAAALVASVLVE